MEDMHDPQKAKAKKQDMDMMDENDNLDDMLNDLKS